MKEQEFSEFLATSNTDKEKVRIFVDFLKEFEKFLKKNNHNINSIPHGEILNYTEYLLEKNSSSVLDFLRALINYANFIKNYDYIVEIIDISESYNAMDNLYQRVAEQYGEKLRNEIYNNIKIPPLGINPEKKPKFTKVILKMLVEKFVET